MVFFSLSIRYGILLLLVVFVVIEVYLVVYNTCVESPEIAPPLLILILLIFFLLLLLIRLFLRWFSVNATHAYGGQTTRTDILHARFFPCDLFNFRNERRQQQQQCQINEHN